MTTTPPASRTLRITGSTIAWTAWILFGVIFEAWALLSGHVKSTLSWKWWSVFRVRQKVPVWLRVVLTVPQLVFLWWIAFHLPFAWLS